jgi:hypothetical protein
MRKLVVALSILLLPLHAHALEIAGVKVAPAIAVHGKTLVLDGAGVRKKFFFKVYVGSLYTERKVSSLEQLLADPGETVIRMHFVYSKVAKRKIVEAFADGLADNSPAEADTPDARAFLSWFVNDFVAGDTVDIALSPDGTVSATQNGRELGVIRSKSLARAVLLIWFGNRPADEDLKRGMLGKG